MSVSVGEGSSVEFRGDDVANRTLVGGSLLHTESSDIIVTEADDNMADEGF